MHNGIANEVLFIRFFFRKRSNKHSIAKDGTSTIPSVSKGRCLAGEKEDDLAQSSIGPRSSEISSEDSCDEKEESVEMFKARTREMIKDLRDEVIRLKARQEIIVAELISRDR